MTDGTQRRPGRPKKYDPAQLKDQGAPKLSIRFDPDLFAFLQEQHRGSRATLEELVRKEASPVRKLALDLIAAVKSQPSVPGESASQIPTLDEDNLQRLALRSVEYAARLLSFGKDDPDAVVEAQKLAVTVMGRIESLSSQKVAKIWKMRLLSATLSLALATSEFFTDPTKSDELAMDGLHTLERDPEEQKAP
jgi:hypothetical protein